MSLADHLRAMGACGESVAWVGKRRSPAAAWRACERGDWLLWILRKKA